MLNRIHRTHIEHAKNHNKVLLPTRNLVFIPLGVDESGEWIPFTLLDDLPLDLGHRTAIETSVNGSPHASLV